MTEFYHDSYGNVRQNGNVAVLIHDAFEDLSYWSGSFLSSAGYSNILMDTHHYEIFSDSQVAMTWPDHLSVRPRVQSQPSWRGARKLTRQVFLIIDRVCPR